jgi:hypothetical protein
MPHRIFLFVLSIVSVSLGVQLCNISSALASIDNTFDVKIGPNIGTAEEMGASVSAGDLNNDGYDDVIVGAYANTSATGKVYIHYGSATGVSLSPDITLTGEAQEDWFGVAVAGAGDVNNDGYDDVLVGVSRNTSYTGKAYIYYGGSSMNSVADVTFVGETQNNFFGFSVSSAGDVNNDGYDDVLVGAHGNTSNTGKAYIYYGGSNMNNVADVTFTGEAQGDYFGYSVSFAGDVNNDGYDDVTVGAQHSNDTGKAYIYYGGSSMNNVTDVTFTGEASSDSFGIAVAGAGDVNNDSYDDVLVGAYLNNTSNAGKAYIYYGGSSMDATADVTFTGEAQGDFFGFSVSSAGDVNNDGYDDVIIGAAGYPNGATTGRAYLYYGGSSMDTVADTLFDAEQESDEFASYQTPLIHGDINNDGAVDLIVGAPGADNGSYDGAVYIYYGTFTPSTPSTPSTSSSESFHHSDTGSSTEEQSIESLLPPTLSHTKKALKSQYNLTYTLTKQRRPLVVPTKDPASLKSLFLRINKQKYVFTINKKNPHQYLLTLPASFKPGKYPYTLTANYGFTTLSTKGIIEVKKK